jgi:hypothetical protein
LAMRRDARWWWTAWRYSGAADGGKLIDTRVGTHTALRVCLVAQDGDGARRVPTAVVCRAGACGRVQE